MRVLTVSDVFSVGCFLCLPPRNLGYCNRHNKYCNLYRTSPASHLRVQLVYITVPAVPHHAGVYVSRSQWPSPEQGQGHGTSHQHARLPHQDGRLPGRYARGDVRPVHLLVKICTKCFNILCIFCAESTCILRGRIILVLM